jgi:cobalt-zinc-cadmium efflux system membrane fusion protein
MKKKLLIFFTVLAACLGVFTWQFYDQIFEEYYKTFPVETADSHEHDSEDEHHHHEHNEDHTIALSDDQIRDVHIGVQKAQSGYLSLSLPTRGKIILHPDRLAHVLPKVSGVAFEARKNTGDSVEKGEIIAVIESREMADIKANFLAAIEKEKLAYLLYEKEERLYDKNISSELEYLNSKASYEESRINLRLAEQKLHALGISEEELCCLADNEKPDLRLYEVRSPINGTIIDRHICNGEYIDNTTAIYEIADLTQVWVEIGIFSKDLNKVRMGQTVQIQLPVDGTEGKANIIFVSPIIKEDTITTKAVAVLENHDGIWRPGTYVNVNIDTDKIPASIVIPTEAVQEFEGINVVFAKVPEGFELRRVQLGNKDNQNVEILAGLDAGEEFAATNTFILKAELGKGEAEHVH